MKKKQYIYPLIDVHVLNTSKLMKTEDSSPGFPPGPGEAPKRKTEVF